MLRTVCVSLTSAAFVGHASVQAASFADSIISYTPGAAASGYTNASAALGQPSRTTPGPFGGPVDPFNPPYLGEQLVSIGAGGSITMGFSSPILNDPRHLFGVDFIIYGNAGFTITNGNYTGGGITDGSLFGANPGATRVSVSADNVNYYQLDPARAPVVDTLFPTDGSGSFDLPVNPALSQTDFAGLDLAGIRRLYSGSAGGAGFDLAWAQDTSGQAVSVPEARFIRIDALNGQGDIDGVAAPGVVPEPAPWLLISVGLGMFALCFRTKKNHARP